MVAGGAMYCGKRANEVDPARVWQTAMMVECPICGRRFELEDSPAPPFCSLRCRRIDLGRWFDESYGLPCEPPEDEQSGSEGGDEGQ